MVMLKAMRRRARRILWVTIILVIPAFIWWGTGGLRERRIDLVATVGGKGITREAYYRKLEGLCQEIRARMGDAFDERMAKALNLERAALSSLIEREILLQEARKKRIKVSDQELREEIKSYPAFQKAGKFDKEAYFAFLDWYGSTPQKFEEEIRREISIAKLREMVLDKVRISEEEIRDEYLKEYEEIEVRYLLIKPAEEVKIEEKEIEEYYEKSGEDYRIPEKIRVRHILIKEEREERPTEKIKEIRKRLREGEDFAKLAKEFSQCPSKGKGGDLGFIKRGDREPEFERVAFGLKEGQISRPVRSRFGYHIIKLEERRESHLPPLDEVRERIERTLKEERGWEMAREKAQEIEREDLEALAKRFSLEVKGTGLFKRGGSDLPREIEEEAFGLKVGEGKGPLRGKDGYYIIRLIKRKGMDEKKFAEEKETFRENYTQRKKNEAYNQWYDNLKKQAKIVTYLPQEE